MKTSLICLLLLPAVTCAAPQAGEMPEEKRVGKAEMMREKVAEKRKEIAEKVHERAEENGEVISYENRKEMAEKMRERAEKKREVAENAVVAAKSDGEAESRNNPCYGDCYGPYGEVGCSYDECYDYNDLIDYSSIYDNYYGYVICACCYDDLAPYCYEK